MPVCVTFIKIRHYLDNGAYDFTWTALELQMIKIFVQIFTTEMVDDLVRSSIGRINLIGTHSGV